MKGRTFASESARLSLFIVLALSGSSLLHENLVGEESCRSTSPSETDSFFSHQIEQIEAIVNRSSASPLSSSSGATTSRSIDSIRGYWTGLEIDRNSLMTITAPLRDSRTVTSPDKMSHDARRDAVVNAIRSSSDVEIFYSSAPREANTAKPVAQRPPERPTPTIRDLKISRSLGEDPSVPDRRQDNPQSFYSQQSISIAGEFWVPHKQDNRPLNDQKVILLNPLKADEGTAVHEFIHALLYESREQCYIQKQTEPQKECPPQMGHDHGHASSSSSSQSLAEDFDEFQRRSAVIREELDVYDILAREGQTLGLSATAIQTAHAGIQVYLYGSQQEELKDIDSLQNLIRDFKAKLQIHSSQSGQTIYQSLKLQLESLESKMQNYMR